MMCLFQYSEETIILMKWNELPSQSSPAPSPCATGWRHRRKASSAAQRDSAGAAEEAVR